MYETLVVEDFLELAHDWYWADDILYIFGMRKGIGTGSVKHSRIEGNRRFHQTTSHYLPTEESGLVYPVYPNQCDFNGDAMVWVERDGQDVLICPNCGATK